MMNRNNIIKNKLMGYCSFFLVLLLLRNGNTDAWAGNRFSGKVIAHKIAHTIPQLRSVTPPSRELSKLHVRPIAVNDDSFTKSVTNLLTAFVKSLGRGIMFAIPMKPAITDALFGIKSKRKNDKNSATNVPSVSFTLREGLVAVGIYFAVGVCGYSLLMEHWSLIDAIYFSVVSFTSVGYGDLYPHTPASKLFTCFFSLGGIAFLAAALASIGSNLVEAELKAVKAAQKLGRRRVMRVFERMPQILAKREVAAVRHDEALTSTVTMVVPFNATSILTGDAIPPRTKAKSGRTIIRDVALKLIPPFAFLISGGIALGRIEGWTVLDSIYYSLITAGTVGYGDFSPTTQRARLCAIFFIPLAVAAGGEVLGSIAAGFLERRRAQVFDNLVNKDFTMDHIKEMDADGDGKVSRLEYTEFMLVEMKLVEKSVLEELRDQFNRLDVTMTDSISKEDLIVMAKLRRNKAMEMKELEMKELEMNGVEQVVS